MTEEEGVAFLQEEIVLLEKMASNSRKQMRKLAKRLWAGLSRLSEERDGYLQLWQQRADLRRQAQKVSGEAVALLQERIRQKHAEVQRLHMQLLQEAQMEKNYQAQHLQRVRQGNTASLQYLGALPTYGGRCNIRG